MIHSAAIFIEWGPLKDELALRCEFVCGWDANNVLDEVYVERVAVLSCCGKTEYEISLLPDTGAEVALEVLGFARDYREFLLRKEQRQAQEERGQ